MKLIVPAPEIASIFLNDMLASDDKVNKTFAFRDRVSNQIYMLMNYPLLNRGKSTMGYCCIASEKPQIPWLYIGISSQQCILMAMNEGQKVFMFQGINDLTEAIIRNLL